MATSLYIGGLPYEITDEQLLAIFKPYGSILQSQVLDKLPGCAERTALLVMGSLAEATWLVQNLHQNIPQNLTTPVTVQFLGGAPVADAGPAAAAAPAMQGWGAAAQPAAGGDMNGMQMKGTVKRFDITKGFGFISPEGIPGSPDVFVHVMDLSDGEALVNGSSVTFTAVLDTTKGPGRYRAKGVTGAVPKEQAGAPPTQPQMGGGDTACDNLFVSGLPLQISEQELMTVFNQYGKVVSLRQLPVQPGKSDSAALIRMETVDSAKWLVDNVNQNIPNGLTTKLNIRYATNNKGKGKGEGAAPMQTMGGYGSVATQGGYAQQGPYAVSAQ